jgi:SH3-like domain-containing protein
VVFFSWHLSPVATRTSSLFVVLFGCAALVWVGPTTAQTAATPPKPAASKPAPPKPVAAKPAPTIKAEAPKPQPAAVASPNESSTAATPEPSLPVPRFVSFRTDPVNLRTGPGVRYPVDWIYMRRRLPVEVIAEFETWRQIRDPDGAEGWIHQSMLSGRRTGMIKDKPQALRKANVDAAETLAMLEPGVIVDVQRCPGDGLFCRIEINGLQGWLKRDQFWGVYPQEKIE